MYKKYYRYGLISLLLLFLLTCTSHTVTDQVYSIKAEGWEYTDKMVFEYAISDTLASYDILIHIRNTKNYSYSNLWLFIETLAPSGKYQRDTLEVTLTDENGRWLGKSTQSINTMLVPYKENIHFSDRGIYQTVIQHAMRDTVLKHITDIGLRIQDHLPK